MFISVKSKKSFCLNYEKGDKLVDKRDNTIHIVECVDVYETVTIGF